MERTRKARTAVRSAFTRALAKCNEELGLQDVDKVNVQACYELLERKFTELNMLDKDIFDHMIDADSPLPELDKEGESVDEYLMKFNMCKTKAFKVMNASDEDSVSVSASKHGTCRRKFKLPTIELKKFGGDVKDWLQFWSQFKKIHEDDDIVLEDKFQYLLQATISGTRARELVESFPPTADNYFKVIDSLKSRFGRDDLLIEVYVRELLKLVLHNALQPSERIGLATLYDKIESYLRALDTLGVTTDKCAAMLYPLVESCMPEDLLRAWQRSSNASRSSSTVLPGGEGTIRSRLSDLMAFMKCEVEGEERISLAVTGFGLGTDHKTSRKKKGQFQVEDGVPTAAGLINTKDTGRPTHKRVGNCVFCDKDHPSEDCFKAQKMSFDEKRRILSNNGCCFLCLKAGHISVRCRASLRCAICGKRHLVLMCRDLTSNKEGVNKRNETADTSLTASTPLVENTLANHTTTEVFLQTLVILLRGVGTERRVRAIIDSGSQKSYILKNAALEMGYSVLKREKIIHALFGGAQTDVHEHECYQIRLGNLDGKYSCNFQALDQTVICGNVSHVSEGPWIQELQDNNIKITDVIEGYGPIEVLIGADVAGKLVTGRRRILKCGLVAVETLLGWTLMGKVPGREVRDSKTMMVSSMFVANPSIKDLWSLDILGIMDPCEKKSRQQMERETKQNFLETVTVNSDGRYEVQMPWIEGHPPLPSNYNMARRRLDTTVRKLKMDGYYEAFQQVLDEWLEEGIIEVVSEEEIRNYAHYLPHRHVVKENSTTKVRPVFDASAREKHFPSLNDCLDKGVNLIERVPSVLTRFRMYKIGVISDIKRAFLQISLCKEDRDYLRFIWVDKKDEGQVVIFRHTRVVFGVSSSPFLLGAVIEHHLQEALLRCDTCTSYSKPTVLRLLNSFYVDNCVTSVENEEELHQFVGEAQKLMLEAKFDLRGWEHTITDDSPTYEAVELSNVLGLKWDRGSDTLELSSECLTNINIEEVTKRKILSMTHRIFDPIGFTSPVSLCPKLLLQETWESKIGWDTEVCQNIRNKFVSWVNELPYLTKLKIPRWINGGLSHIENWSLHTFCDASHLAYAAAVFLRIDTSLGVYVQLVQAKSRVAPAKKMTIPRLELLAASIGARLSASVTEDLSVSDISTFFWTDSSTVLSWIQREDQWATFVWNRVVEIRRLTSHGVWRHVPGSMNPADLPSRGCSAIQLLESRWWEGPSWLKKQFAEWPNIEFSCQQDEINAERKKKVTSTFMICEKKNREEQTPGWYFRYFSNYQKVVRLVGWVRRFVSNCRRPSHQAKNELSVQEIEDAEREVVKYIQQESFTDENDKQIVSLHPFKDEQSILRLKTKITLREDTKDFRYPMILPAYHPVVKLMIREKHERLCHVGVQGLLSNIREQFWVLSGRRAIKSVISKCVVCKRQDGRHLESMPAPLPADRIRDASVFEITGVDFAGPVYIKGGQKAWICLFTCAVFRAVHLELVSSLSTPDFVQALRRFIGRRGRPSVIYSDNGRNLVGAANSFERLDWQKISEFSTAQRIKWKFNPPTASWWGGWWERLIRMMKQLIRKVLGRALLSFEEMTTVLCDCEAVVNARPLTYISNNSTDLIPLTPAMFLHEIRETGVPDCDNVNTHDLNRRICYQQKLREHLRQRFRIEYLGQLIQRSSSVNPRDITVGEVVFVGNDNTKRLDWPLARIEELKPGRDGAVRLVRLKTSTGTFLRPIQRVYPLEVSSLDKHCIEGKITEKIVGPNENSRTVTRCGREVKLPRRFLL